MSNDFVEEFDTDDEQPQSVVPQIESDTALVLSTSENVNNENRERELQQSGETNDGAIDASYMEHLTYDVAGVAIYTDPNTNSQYKWCTIENKWVPYQKDKAEGESSTSSSENSSNDLNSNPYENEYYFWSTEKNEWLLKASYDYNEVEKKWIPKSGVSEDTSASSSQNQIYLDDNGKRCYTDKDGAAYEWDDEKKAWFPKIDDDFMAVYQLNYGNYVAPEKDETSKKEQETPKSPKSLSESDDTQEESKAVNTKKRKKLPEEPKWFELSDQHNTKVYVENLPLDIKEEEFTELMSKYGMILKDPTTHKYRLKLYKDESGQLKGDGLCTYIKVSGNIIFKILLTAVKFTVSF